MFYLKFRKCQDNGNLCIKYRHPLPSLEILFFLECLGAIMFVWVHFFMQSLQKKFIFCIQMGRPWINPDQRVGQLLRESQKYSLREPQKESLRTTNPPTTTLVSVVAAPTHLPCISHHPTHPLPTKSLRCQVSTAPRAIAPPLNTRACMTWAHAKFQENSSCFFWYISWCKVFKKVHFLHSNGPPPESTLNQRVGQLLRDSQKCHCLDICRNSLHATCICEVSTVKCWKPCHHWDISPSGRHRDGDQCRFPKLLRVLVPRVQVKTVGVTHGLGTLEGVKTMELSINYIIRVVYVLQS